MSWTVKKHIIPGFFTREFAGATQKHNDRLKVVVNQYIPSKYAPREDDGAITLVVAHANAFHKELYEPFLEDFLKFAEKSGILVRGAWIIDAPHQGESGEINQHLLGDEPSWNDYARDIMQVCTTFGEEMPEPRIGIGHSMGGQSIFQAALWHPRLFNTVVGIDPVIEVPQEDIFPITANPAAASQRRRDIWPDRAAAEKFFRSRPFYKQWDPRVLDLHLKYGIIDLPTATYPNEKGVTLQTTKHQEVWTFVRHSPGTGYDRPEPHATFENLPKMPVPIFWIFGEDSVVCREDSIERKLKQNPSAEHVVIPDAGHLVVMDKPTLAAEALASYLTRFLPKWKSAFDVEWSRKRDFHIQEPLRKRLTPSKL